LRDLVLGTRDCGHEPSLSIKCGEFLLCVVSEAAPSTCTACALVQFTLCLRWSQA